MGRKGKRRETSPLVRRLLQLVIHARDHGELDQRDSGGVLKIVRFWT